MRRTVCLILLLILMVSGCSAASNQDENLGETYSFEDDLGRQVTVSDPERVACLMGSFAEMWQLAGGEVAATADDAWEDKGLVLQEDTVNIGQMNRINLEKLLEAQPDFIIASSNNKINMELRETLESTGIATAYFEIAGFDDYLRVLKIFTEITGRDDMYEKNGLQVKSQMEAVLEKSRQRLQEEEAPSVLILRVSASTKKARNSSNTVLGEMLKELGCVNIADEDDNILENLSLEHIIQKDPDYIFTVQHGSDDEGTRKLLDELFGKDSAWGTLTAVKEGRLYHMDKKLYNLKPNARWGEAYEGLEEILADQSR